MAQTSCQVNLNRLVKEQSHLSIRRQPRSVHVQISDGLRSFLVANLHSMSMTGAVGEKALLLTRKA
jgi:hypothetical protein